MHEYEYVTRAEYQPVRERLEKIIRRVQVVMRKKYDTTFQFQLIGSGKRHLVTRKKGGNTGYDFDYNLILQAPEPGYHYLADVVKKQFMTAFSEAIKGTEYTKINDSTSAITIKVVDTKNSRITHSCDFAIIYYDEDKIENGYCYLKCKKDRNTGKQDYVFELRSTSRDIDSVLDYVLEYRNGWNFIRDEYLKLKNNNHDPNKHSFSLYLEAVHNVANWLYNGEEEDDDYDE